MPAIYKLISIDQVEVHTCSGDTKKASTEHMKMFHYMIINDQLIGEIEKLGKETKEADRN